MKKEEEYFDLESEYRLRHLQRVGRDHTKSVVTHEIHMELMDLLKQINVYTANIAKTMTSLKFENNDPNNQIIQKTGGDLDEKFAG
ncbi:MAG: hypothetical protein DWQ10_17270 [Calditrichaeota bacterium]|nr:MAG: hypothetical protein DWQ10_17270 [Calditrichota bacterium]